MYDLFPHMNAEVKILLKWCAANSVYIDQRLQIQVQNETQDIGVFSSTSSIPQGTILVKIPKDIILSVRTCTLSQYIKFIPYGVGAQLSLSLALYVEILRQDQSKWYGYLRSLPNGLVNLPIFWTNQTSCCEANDGEEALLWLTGTEAAKILNSKTDKHSSLLDEITCFFFDIAEPLLFKHLPTWAMDNTTPSPTISGFYRAFSLVSSRAFMVDTYHGLSMVAVADAFNHTVDNHVHLESEFYVCPECGSFKECPHDIEITPSTPNKAGRRHSVEEDHDHESFYEMVSNTIIPPNSEVFNTYGETLSNAQLLNQYGFILDVNENDRLVWTSQEVLNSCFSDTILQDGVEAEIHRVSQLAMDTLLHCPDLFDHSQLVSHEAHAQEYLCLNDEGKISAQLWTLLFAASLQFIDRDFASVAGLVKDVFGLELVVESSMEVEEADDQVQTAVDPVMKANPVVLRTLFQIASFVVGVCGSRKQNSGKPGSSQWNLSDFLEELPESRDRTRLAVSLLLSERSILDACIAGWSSLMKSITRCTNQFPLIPYLPLISSHLNSDVRPNEPHRTPFCKG